VVLIGLTTYTESSYPDRGLQWFLSVPLGKCLGGNQGRIYSWEPRGNQYVEAPSVTNLGDDFLLFLFLIITKTTSEMFVLVEKQCLDKKTRILFLFCGGPKATTPIASPSALGKIQARKLRAVVIYVHIYWTVTHPQHLHYTYVANIMYISSGKYRWAESTWRGNFVITYWSNLYRYWRIRECGENTIT
jgi:hypothetical protein